MESECLKKVYRRSLLLLLLLLDFEHSSDGNPSSPHERCSISQDCKVAVQLAPALSLRLRDTSLAQPARLDVSWSGQCWGRCSLVSWAVPQGHTPARCYRFHFDEEDILKTSDLMMTYTPSIGFRFTVPHARKAGRAVIAA